MAQPQVKEEELDYGTEEMNPVGGGDDAPIEMDEDISAPEIPTKSVSTTFIGHARNRTSGFQNMLLKPELLKAISEAGFEHPSEVQHQVIPQAMLGLDILCQAKSGMGKTAVFVITSLQELDANDPGQPSIIALAPTRELAFQIASEYQRFKKHMPGVRLGLFFGGTSVVADATNLARGPVHIVVGTPGRLLDLIEREALNLGHIKTFIVDECDKMLMGKSMHVTVEEIFQACPATKQVLMLSATLPTEILPKCNQMMKNPVILTVHEDCDLTLEKLHQHYVKVVEKDKTQTLFDLLDLLEFNQVIVFTNTVVRCLALGKLLEDHQFPAITIHSDMEQYERLEKYYMFKTFEKRLLVATDLFGRGMDIQRVNIVINYDCPTDTDVYLHRIARAGRFDTKGMSITFIATEQDSELLNKVQDRFDISITELPDELDPAMYMEKVEGEEMEATEESRENSAVKSRISLQ